jgi:hypothetical protein
MRYKILEMDDRRKQEVWVSRKILNTTVFFLKAGLHCFQNGRPFFNQSIMLSCCRKSLHLIYPQPRSLSPAYKAAKKWYSKTRSNINKAERRRGAKHSSKCLSTLWTTMVKNQYKAGPTGIAVQLEHETAIRTVQCNGKTGHKSQRVSTRREYKKTHVQG